MAKARPSIDDLVMQAIAAETGQDTDVPCSGSSGVKTMSAAAGRYTQLDAVSLLAVTSIPSAVHQRMRTSRFAAR